MGTFWQIRSFFFNTLPRLVASQSRLISVQSIVRLLYWLCLMTNIKEQFENLQTSLHDDLWELRSFCSFILVQLTPSKKSVKHFQTVKLWRRSRIDHTLGGIFLAIFLSFSLEDSIGAVVWWFNMTTAHQFLRYTTFNFGPWLSLYFTPDRSSMYPLFV